MNELVARALGRASLGFDYLRPLTLRLAGRAPGEAAGEFDRTGLVREGRPVDVFDDDGVVLVRYASFAHSLWRSQEVSLFRGVRKELVRPLLDFGCGDGTFGSLVFDRVDVGVDNDPLALEHCRSLAEYGELVVADAGRIPLPDASVRAAFANSVFEHVRGVEAVLGELGRVLAPGGVLATTMVTKGYERHLTRFFGRRESERVNAAASHHTLLEADGWVRLLETAGFTVERTLEYQPPELTYVVRMSRLLGRRGLGLVWPGGQDAVWRRYRRQLVELVRRSIAGVDDGANVFVLARRR